MGKGSWSLLVCAVLTMACREEKKAEPTDEPAGSVALDTADVPFTAPEVRRTRSDSDVPEPALPDTARQAAAGASSNSPSSPEAQAPRPAPAAPAVAPPAPSAPPPAVTAPAAPVSVSGSPLPGPTGDYVVQIDIHKSESDALKAVQKLATRGIPAYIVPAAADAGLSGSYWRVRVGRFASRADAQSYGENVLKPAGLKFWIDRKANEPAGGGKG